MTSLERLFGRLLIVVLLLALTSCSVQMLPTVREQSHTPDLNIQKTSTSALAEEQQGLVDEEQKTPAQQQKLQQDIETLDQQQAAFNKQLSGMIKEGKSVDSKTPSSPATNNQITNRQEVSFNFDGADLLEVVRLFMQQLLKQDFLIYPGVKGSVTMAIEEQLSPEQIQHLLEGVLQINHMSMFYQDDRWHVMPLADVPSALSANNLLLPQQNSIPRGQQIKAYRLDYIVAAEMVKILTPYLSKGAQLYAHESSGVLLVCDYPHVIAKIGKLIKLFDVSPFVDLQMKVYWPKYVLVDKLIKELDALKKSISPGPGSLNSQISFVALPRLNLLLTMARNDDLLYFVDMWVKELDREEPQVLQQNEEDGIFIYSVKNGSADEIVKVLTGLFGSGAKEKISPDKNKKFRRGLS